MQFRNRVYKIHEVAKCNIKVGMTTFCVLCVEGTARRRFDPEAAGSHRPLEESRPPVLVGGRAAGRGCTGSPWNRILLQCYCHNKWQMAPHAL